MKRAHVFILITLIICSVQSIAQNWELDWEKQYNGKGMSFFTDALNEKNGGFTILGSIENADTGIFDFLLFRISESGDTIWSKMIKSDDGIVSKCIAQSYESGYLIGGSGFSESTRSVLLIRVDDEGNELWRKKMGEGDPCVGGKLIALDDGGFMMTGTKLTDDSGK